MSKIAKTLKEDLERAGYHVEPVFDLDGFTLAVIVIVVVAVIVILAIGKFGG